MVFRKRAARTRGTCSGQRRWQCAAKERQSQPFAASLRRAALLLLPAVFAGLAQFAGSQFAGWAQSAALPSQAAPASARQIDAPDPNWNGLPLRRISFDGVTASRLQPLPGQFDKTVGQPLSPEFLKTSLRELYATGLYETIEAAGEREGDGVALVFRGTPRMFVGTVSVDGARGPTMNTQLERAAELAPGTQFTEARLNRAIEQMRSALTANGYYEPVILDTVIPHPDQQVTDIAFHVNSGPQARIGTVEVSGDAGMSAEQFRRKAHLKAGEHVDHDTVNHALDGVLKHYQGQERLEADVKLESQEYVAEHKTTNFRFTANRGPVVQVEVQGASIEEDRMRRLVPVFEEGSVDEDLLNEGNRRLRDYFQGMGYFDVKVSHREETGNAGAVSIVFTVQLGARRRVESVAVTGNRYFKAATLKDLLSVHAATRLDRHGAYSQALVASDVNALETVYRDNGFPNVKVTPETSTPETVAADPSAVAANPPPSRYESRRVAPLTVTYHVDEGLQMRVASVRIEGNSHLNAGLLTPLLNTEPGQLLSPQNLAGDRDALLTMYLSRGFNQVTVDVAQQPAQKPNEVDVAFQIHEGEQVFVRNVLVTGLHYTRPQTVEQAIAIHTGDPLNQTALLDTQRNLYEYALFNEVTPAIENPDGGEPDKTVLLQITEARRWALTYGFGFEAQTGQPQNNCAGAFAAGVKCDPNGKTGVSPRVIADVTRNNLFGREQSASLQTTYGLLEQRIGLLYQVPHFEGRRSLGFTFSGGYANSQDVTTYVASRLDGAMRWTENFLSPGFLSKANTFIYEIDFRRVKVAASSLQVYPGAISELSTAVRVSGPSFTWIRDTRDSAMEAHRGTYTSFQEFLSARSFGSEAEFNRIDTTNSSYYGFDRDRIVLARSTRYGQVRAFGAGFSGLIPLPERLYAGGATSMRGFSQNAAGPRDPETGFPIGGAGALINSTELRLPPPTLPWIGNTISFVLFHDMGNVFSNAGDAWASALRIHQPDRAACEAAVANVNDSNSYIPQGNADSTGVHGPCNFNYFSQTPGVGLRYHTPVGPVRFDFSYNLNPPVFPVNINYSIPTAPGSTIPGFATDPHLGQAPHFNFFFSLGQTF